MSTIIIPTIRLKDSYCAYINELAGEERYPYPMDLDHADFVGLVTKLTDYSKGLNLPNWMVPNSTYWLVQEDEIVGCSHLRHELNESLAYAGGHIGLGIRPSYRGKGLGKVLLKLTLEKALEKHIEHVHIHCHDSNIKSKRLIESVGAKLESKIKPVNDEPVILRYIFDQA